MKIRALSVCVLSFLWFSVSSHAQSDEGAHQLSRDILKQLIEINTTDSVGNVTTAANAMAPTVPGDAGFADSDIQVIGPKTIARRTWLCGCMWDGGEKAHPADWAFLDCG